MSLAFSLCLRSAATWLTYHTHPTARIKIRRLQTDGVCDLHVLRHGKVNRKRTEQGSIVGLVTVERLWMDFINSLLMYKYAVIYVTDLSAFKGLQSHHCYFHHCHLLPISCMSLALAFLTCLRSQAWDLKPNDLPYNTHPTARIRRYVH